MVDYAFPLATGDYADILGIEEVTWHTERYDEYSGVASGHDLQAELANPKWTARANCRFLYLAEAKRVEAMTRKLHGSQHAIYLHDPRSSYPANDPEGVVLGANTVQIATIGGDRQSLTLKGLPPGYVLTFGDKGQISFSSGTRNFFFEFADEVTASGLGVTPTVEIFPHLPTGIVVDATVNLRKPACKMIIKPPNGYNPGVSRGPLVEGISFEFLERI